MKVSHEVPICLLNISSLFNNYDYCLPHLLDIYPQYLEYFTQTDNYVIMDNSLHELGKAYDHDRLLYWINQLTPDEFIVPDVWENMNQTIVNAREWIQIPFPENVTKVAVAQGKNITELANCIETFKNLGYTKYAISYGASFYNEVGTYHPNIDLSKMFGRIDTVHSLYKMGVICNSDRVHLLGCSLPQEFHYYDGLKFIETIDTSNPIMAALEHTYYSELGLFKKTTTKINDDMGIDIADIDFNKILYNVNKFKQINNL